MRQSIFVDGVAEVAVIGGVVRIDFFSLAPNRDGAGNGSGMVRVPVVTVAMPLSGFAGSMEALENVRAKMIADGVVQKGLDRLTEPDAKVRSKNFD
jgi:hypothetical protein